jgi:hypothetical protein
MGNKGVDLIEVGRGNQSKVIGQNNSISEYGAVVLSLIGFVGQGTFVLWLVLWLGLYFLDFQIIWAMGISAILSLVITAMCLWGIIKLIMVLHKVNNPPQPRDERGRFVRDIPVSSGGSRVGTLRTAENGESEYISEWGGGG